MRNPEQFAGRGVVRYDARERQLLISKPWGILRLRADPVDASALDLRRSPGLEWTRADHVRLDLRKHLRLVSDVLVGSKWKWSERGFAPTAPRHPIDPAVAECAAAWRSWLHAVGREACQAIARYHPSLQYPLLWYASRCPKLDSLVRTNPGLAVGLVLAVQSQRNNLPDGSSAITAMSEGKERLIAERLHLTPQAWRVLAKIQPRTLTPERWFRFRAAWNASRRVQEVAPHLDHLGPMTLDLLAWYDSLAMVTNRVIHQAAQLEADSPQLAADLSAILQVLLWKEQGEPDMHVRLRSLEQLQRLVGNVQSHLEHEDVAEALRYRFPKPPLPGEPGYVEPILNAKDLCWESIVMQNCAISYARQISRAQGQTYFYRGYPQWGLQRCTIGIKACENDAGRCWQVFEVRARHNRWCPGTAKSALRCFFEDQQAAISGGDHEPHAASMDLAQDSASSRTQ